MPKSRARALVVRAISLTLQADRALAGKRRPSGLSWGQVGQAQNEVWTALAALQRAARLLEPVGSPPRE